MYLDFLVLSAFAVKNAIFSQSASSLLQQTQYIYVGKKEKIGEEKVIFNARPATRLSSYLSLFFRLLISLFIPSFDST